MGNSILIEPLEDGFLIKNGVHAVAGLSTPNDLVEWIAKKYGATNVIDDEAIGSPGDQYTFADFGVGGLPSELEIVQNPFETVSDAKPVTLDDLESTVKEVHARKRPGPTIEEQGEVAEKQTSKALDQERHKNQKWTTPELDRAAEMWAKGWTVSQIADALGVTRGAVSGLTNRNPDRFPSRTAAKTKTTSQKQACQKPVLPKGQNKLLKHLELVASKTGGEFNIDTEVLARKAGVDRESSKPFLNALADKGLIDCSFTGNNAFISVKDGVAA